MVSLLNTWIKSDFKLTSAVDTEFMDITSIWNDFVDAWNADFEWVTGTLFGGTKLNLVKLDGVHTNVPVSVNIPFFGDIDFWDFLFSVLYYKWIGNVNILGFSVPIGVLGYWILRSVRVPFFGTDDIIQLSQAENSKFGDMKPGFTFKDATYDIAKFYMLAKLLGVLGQQGVHLLMQAIHQINAYRAPRIKDVILRIAPEGASLRFDDDTELAQNEKLNYAVNYIDKFLAYLLDPTRIILPSTIGDEEMKGEPDIGF